MESMDEQQRNEDLDHNQPQTLEDITNIFTTSSTISKRPPSDSLLRGPTEKFEELENTSEDEIAIKTSPHKIFSRKQASKPGIANNSSKNPNKSI